MNCSMHTDRTAVARCTECGAGLCEVCRDKLDPPLCINCAKKYAQSIKFEMIKNISISIVLMILGAVFIESPLGVLLAGIPYGWSLLNKITPSMFLWLSWVGWLIYILIKLILSYVVGIPALIIKLVIWITKLTQVNNIMKSVSEGE